MWELDHKESWALKNWCFWIVLLEKALENPLVFKEIQPVHPKGNQSWIFIRRTGIEAEAAILWPPDVENRLIGKDPHAQKDWRQEEKGWQRMRWLDGITNFMAMSLSWWWTVRPSILQPMGSQRVGHDWATELNWWREHCGRLCCWPYWMASLNLYPLQCDFSAPPNNHGVSSPST